MKVLIIEDCEKSPEYSHNGYNDLIMEVAKAICRINSCGSADDVNLYVEDALAAVSAIINMDYVISRKYE